jgi:WD40 repeat protein
MGKKMVVRNTTTNDVVEADEHTADVSPNSRRFTSGSEDKTVRIFSITGQRVLRPLGCNLFPHSLPLAYLS